ncbi:MAG: hypothetical protein ACK58T_43215, partial [Phycisphaerae bacterium]
VVAGAESAATKGPSAPDAFAPMKNDTCADAPDAANSANIPEHAARFMMSTPWRARLGVWGVAR